MGGSPNSTHKNMPYRLDKSSSALAAARLKINEPRKHSSTGSRMCTTFLPEVSTQVNKFEQVSSLDHQMSVLVGGGGEVERAGV